MLMLIAVICIVFGTVMAAVQLAKIRNGWVAPKFAGRTAEFLRHKRKEFTIIAWAGAACGPLYFVLAALDWGKPAAYERLVYGVILIICGAAGFVLRAKLPTAPAEIRP